MGTTLLTCGNDLLTCGNDLLTCGGNGFLTCGNDLLTCGNDLLTCGNKIKKMQGKQFYAPYRAPYHCLAHPTENLKSLKFPTLNDEFLAMVSEGLADGVYEVISQASV